VIVWHADCFLVAKTKKIHLQESEGHGARHGLR
jgi:hypothetical protein